MNGEQVRTLALTSVAHFINDGQSAIFPLLFPLLAYFVTSSMFIAIIATVFYILSSFASPFATGWAERSGNMGRGMGVGLLILAFGTIGLGIAIAPSISSPEASYLLVLVFASVAGLGSSFFHPIGASLIQLSFEEHVQGFALGINGTSGSLGRALFSTISAAVFSYLTLAHDTYFALMYGMIILGFSGLVVALLVLAYFTHGRGVTAKRRQSAREQIARLGPVVRRTWLLILITVVRNVQATGIFIFLSAFLLSEKFLTYGVGLGLVFTVMLAGPIGGQPLFGRMSDYLGRKASLLVTTIGSGAFMILFLVSSSLYPYSLVFLVLFGAFAFSGFPILLPIAYSQLPPESRAAGNSVIWAAIGSGSAAGPVVTQLLAARDLAGSLYGSFMVLSVVTVLISFLSLGVRVNRDVKERKHSTAE